MNFSILSRIPESWLEPLAEFATVIVIIGIFLEYTPPVREHFKKAWYERPKFRKTLLHIVGPVLVILGITAELGFHHVDRGITDARDIEQRKEIVKIAERAASLENEAAQLRLALVRRHITEKQESCLVAKLTNFKKTGNNSMGNG